MGVVVILGVMAVVVAPSLQGVARSQQSGLITEVERRLSHARAHAMTTGEPSGVRIDVAGGEVSSLRIAAAGAAPTAIPDPTGAAGASLTTGSMMGGVGISSFQNGDGGANRQVIWFNYEGTPQTRQGDGTDPEAFTEDAVITFPGGAQVFVRRVSGLIER
ncbi:MAG: hypothetical protein VYC34_11460 [Planctomycetota bacterium]|nr:hypothetical protein [Planctomycetota bacterium]